MNAAFCLPATLTMTTIGAVADELRTVPLDDIVMLDVSELSAPDLSVLQLIESLRAEARQQGGEVRLTAPAGDALTAVLHRAGFTDALSPDDNAFWFHGVPLQ